MYLKNYVFNFTEQFAQFLFFFLDENCERGSSFMFKCWR